MVLGNIFLSVCLLVVGVNRFINFFLLSIVVFVVMVKRIINLDIDIV